jgi:hypothetical protein
MSVSIPQLGTRACQGIAQWGLLLQGDELKESQPAHACIGRAQCWGPQVALQFSPGFSPGGQQQVQQPAANWLMVYCAEFSM